MARPPSAYRSRKFSIYAPPDLAAALDAAVADAVAKAAAAEAHLSESAALVVVLRRRFGLTSPGSSSALETGTQIALPLEPTPATPPPSSPGSSSAPTPPPAVEPEPPAVEPEPSQVVQLLPAVPQVDAPEPEPAPPPPAAPAVPPPARTSRGGAPRRAAPPPAAKGKTKGAPAPAKGKRR